MASPPALLALSDELLLHVCAFLDVPELLSVSRVMRIPIPLPVSSTAIANPKLTTRVQTCHRLRRISLDPILHHTRLFITTPLTISYHLPRRPSLITLRPPASTIYLTTIHLAARALSRALTALHLKARLSRRPPISLLVSHNILPTECCKHDHTTGEVIYGGLAPGLIGLKRSVEKERVKDRLRRWVVGERRMGVMRVAAERGWVDTLRGQELMGRGKDRERLSVRLLVQRFARRARGLDGGGGAAMTTGRWGRSAVTTTMTTAKDRSRVREAPTRAHVLALRRFWEGVSQREGNCVVAVDAASSIWD